MIQKHHTVGVIQKSNIKIVDRGKIYTPNINTWPLIPNTQIHDLWPLTHKYMTTDFHGLVQYL